MQTFKVGQKVKLTQPETGEEDARYIVAEWNGDRGFVRLICDLPIQPVELVRSEHIEVVEDVQQDADA